MWFSWAFIGFSWFDLADTRGHYPEQFGRWRTWAAASAPPFCLVMAKAPSVKRGSLTPSTLRHGLRRMALALAPKCLRCTGFHHPLIASNARLHGLDPSLQFVSPSTAKSRPDLLVSMLGQVESTWHRARTERTLLGVSERHRGRQFDVCAVREAIC